MRLFGFAVLVALLASSVSMTVATVAPDGHSLKVFGNANMDDAIDEEDIEYVRGIIEGTNAVTELADANYNGKIDEEDIAQIELIISGDETELTLIDMANRTVTIPMPVERVVPAGLKDDFRTLIQLGAADKIVGINNYVKEYSYEKPATYWAPERDAAPELGSLPDVGGYKTPNIEIIVSLKPDVIFEYAPIPDVADSIQDKIGVPVVCVESSQFDFDMLRIMGLITGTEDRAEELISYANDNIANITAVTSKIPESEKPKVYCVSGTSGVAEITKTWGRYDPINIAGGINVAEEFVTSSGSVMVSKEQILAWNPDIILIHGVSPPHAISIEDVLSDPDLQKVNAVKNRNVNYTKGYAIGWDPATGLSECYYLAKLFHPDLFIDLDEEEIGDEILETFYGIKGLYTNMLDLSDRYRWMS
ncbi:MAG: corrinoid ABC transporter substrate-binding protein [Methanosaeta sp. PtaU1.Bin112]|nr:MAG: corrinoid ABC transporter substrate-binding protein [Methanosaeta sp. PtaU1.Bin112]